jgi:hypothetical protein
VTPTAYGVVVGDAERAAHDVVLRGLPVPGLPAFEAGDLRAGRRRRSSAGKVKVEYRMVSFLDRASKNEYSSRAANAALRRADTAGPDAFQKFHDLLYAEPAGGGHGRSRRRPAVAWPCRRAPTRTRCQTLIEDGAFDRLGHERHRPMSKDGVNGTPTAFIDGKPAGADPAAMAAAVLKLVG